jgi:hypothetical protein
MAYKPLLDKTMIKELKIAAVNIASGMAFAAIVYYGLKSSIHEFHPKTKYTEIHTEEAQLAYIGLSVPYFLDEEIEYYDKWGEFLDFVVRDQIKNKDPRVMDYINNGYAICKSLNKYDPDIKEIDRMNLNYYKILTSTICIKAND